jgi:hypothetical protein
LPEGELKNTIKILLQNVYVKNKLNNFDNNFDVSFSSIFLSRFRVFSAMGVQKHYKKRFTKTIVSKSFYKKFDQKSKTDFFSNCFSHVFGRFSMRGVQKHDKKSHKNLTLVLFRTLTHPPTHHGGHRFVFGGPLARDQARKMTFR